MLDRLANPTTILHIEDHEEKRAYSRAVWGAYCYEKYIKLAWPYRRMLTRTVSWQLCRTKYLLFVLRRFLGYFMSR
jgi:hypothetical protein